MPYMPVFARMPDGTDRLVWADPDTEILLGLYDGLDVYLVDIKTEEDFEELQRALREMKQRQMRAN
jgi:hypothetical protein